MKVYLNLAVTPSLRERYALAWAVPTFVVALLVFAFLAYTAIHDFRRSREIKSLQADVQAQDASLRARETAIRLELEKPKSQHVIHETEFVNHVIDQRQFSLTDLTVRVSKLLPYDVKLNGLGLAGTESQPEVQFAVVGKNEKAIESFLDHLEDSKDFSNVVIKNQGFRGGPSNGAEEVALVCTARYLAVGTSAPALP